MIAYVKGELAQKQIGYVVIDVGGLGYKIFMSEPSIDEIGNIGDTVKVHTYYRVSEDDISLFGFNTQEELRMFELLISVSGIGSKSAITILSNITPASFALAVISNNIELLKKIPGIGAKTAQRIVLELQDKLKAQQKELMAIEEQEEIIKATKPTGENVDEAMQALQILGYNKREIEKAFEKIANTDVSVEELIKKGLSLLAR